MAKVQQRLKRKKPRHFIREWRQYRGLTLEQLAERVDLTHGAISQLERGVTSYTQRTLEALAFALQCEPADLIMRDPNSPSWSIMDSISGLPEAEQRRISSIIDAIRKAG